MPDPTSTIRPFTDEDLEACVAICAANHPEYIFLHEIEEHLTFYLRHHSPRLENKELILACNNPQLHHFQD